MSDPSSLILKRIEERLQSYNEKQLLLVEGFLDTIDHPSGGTGAGRVETPPKGAVRKETPPADADRKEAPPAPMSSSPKQPKKLPTAPIDDETRDKLKDAFKRFDADGSGSLDFEEFFTLVKKGNPSFKEKHAHDLFRIADSDDLGGKIAFNEFVDFIFSSKKMKRAFDKAIKVVDEEEGDARKKVLSRPVMMRSGALESVRASGRDWSKLTWIERLQAIDDYNAGTTDSSPEASKIYAASAPVSSFAGVTPAPTSPSTNKFANMSLEELVRHSINNYDLTFAGTDPAVMRQLMDFRESLNVLNPPTDEVEIIKYLAKGTAGRVFLAERKSTGKRVALKLVRMTQALGGIKEWYVSKVLKEAGVVAVLMDEVACVLAKAEAPPIIEEHLRDAGPVPYYLCLLQEFMNGGSLENLQKDDRLTWGVFFKAAEEISSTLALMHDIQVQHKDIKPENALVEVDGDTIVAVKLCDFGSAEMGTNPAGCANDIRRFGLTMYSLASGQLWTKNRLLRANHEELVERLTSSLSEAANDTVRQLPQVIASILDGKLDMKTIAKMMAELNEAYKASLH